ncbi:serine hydrolase [Persicobacter sp. CCB-QB2]|uniref:serine hydrolase domain-containing protein n=1 Tax=Persicobacter sp. CCB-QB2 TaxID=1561025 RepID=UPI0006A95979|nr:serine hydrolase [Persicobacter sp. CCB-QB2]
MNRKVIFWASIALLLFYGAWYGYARLPIINGYASKMMCSCVFVSERSPEDILATDLNFSLIKYASPEVDYDRKTVTSTVWGLGAETSVYQEGLGCTLVADSKQPPALEQAISVWPDRPDTLMWPVGDFLGRGKPYPALKKVMDKAFQKEKKTRAVLVTRGDELIWEQYAEGFDENTRLLGWSMTKSITSALIGILVGDGQLDIHAPAPVVDWQSDQRKNITLNHLLQMSSGLDWVEDYGDISYATTMLYASSDMGKFASNVPLAHKPGRVWYYSSGTSNILTKIIYETLGDQRAYYQFARKRLFNPCGMRSMVLEPDASGNFVGSSYSFATTRDWARFGLLYLNDGIFNGERILPEGWVDYSRQAAKSADGEYGAQWWLNESLHFLPDCPADVYFADGFQGQRVWVIPSHDLVVVRLGLSSGEDFDFNEFLSGVLKAVAQDN